MDTVTTGIIAYILGVIFNVLYPYLTAYLTTGEAFDYKYAISRVIASVIAALTAVVVPGFIDWLAQTAAVYDYPSLYAASVFIFAYGAGALGRETQKLGKEFINRA